MTMTPSLWKALESIPGLLAVDAEWRAHLGPDYAFASDFFHAEEGTASTYPCINSPPCGRHSIRRYGDRILARPPAGEDCVSFPLQEHDLALIRLNHTALAAALSPLLPLAPASGVHPSPTRTPLMGFYGALRIPVHLAVATHPHALCLLARELCGSRSMPTILLTTSPSMSAHLSSDVSLREIVLPLALSDHFDLGPKSTFRLRAPLDALLAAFHARAQQFLPAVLPVIESIRSAVEGEATRTRSLESAVTTKQAIIDDMAEGADRFIGRMAAEMKDKTFYLFFLYLAKVDSVTGPRHLSLEEIAERLKLKSRQAVNARRLTLQRHHPQAWQFIQSIRSSRRSVATSFSNLSAKDKRRLGLDVHQRR